MVKYTITFFVILFMFTGMTLSGPGNKTGIQALNFEKTLSRQVMGRYYLYLPKDYHEKKAWPLLLYLHGNMGRGDDLSKIDWYPLPKMMAENDSLPFIIIAPLCPLTDTWTDAEPLISLVDEISANYAVDTTRIYLAGYSMGGGGVWFLAYKYPEKFAAIAPMSGTGNPLWAPQYKDLPIWVFYNTGVSNHYTVPAIEAMIAAVRKQGGSIKVTVHPDRNHRPPTVEEHRELFKWFLEQKSPTP